MGQGPSCSGEQSDNGLIRAIQIGHLEKVKIMLEKDPSSVLELTSPRDRLSALHIAAASGRIEILSMLLDRAANPDLLNRYKQTPLMLAATFGKIACVERLIQAGANMLMFDAVNRKTCLHYAACNGHTDCLQVLLEAANSSSVAASWGFARFVNIRDGTGATPLHLAARHSQANCVHVLLDKGALVCASTGGYGYSGSTPLHFAARGGSLDCVRELLAWGADRLQRDASGKTPYMVALKYKNVMCAALLNPLSAEPLVWPSELKFISQLNPDAKVLLERALIDSNKKREKSILKEAVHSVSSPLNSNLGGESESEGSDAELCCICFEQACTIQVQECGHQMCAHCTLALCCQNKPKQATVCAKPLLCPFCRSIITELVVARSKNDEDSDNDKDDDFDDYDIDAEVEMSPSKPRRSRKYWSYSEGSSSFKEAMGSLGKMVGRSSGKVVAECSEEVDKT